MPKQIWLECPACSYRERLGRSMASCPKCGGLWLDARYDYTAIESQLSDLVAARPFTMWRYWELLPLHDPANILTMGEGGTPLLAATNLGLMLGRPNVFVKDERQGPTGSFKDRQASMAISYMKEQGITEAVVASTGNVAISYSAYSALAGIKLWTFLTSSVPADKMREVALYGSEVINVTGTYVETKKVAADFAEHKGLHLDRGEFHVLQRFVAEEERDLGRQLPEILVARVPVAQQSHLVLYTRVPHLFNRHHHPPDRSAHAASARTSVVVTR